MTFADRLRRIPLLVRILVPVALAALIAWPLGGWDTVTLVSRTLPEYQSNQVFHSHRFDIRVDDAWITTTQHPLGYEAEPGEVFLVIRADVTNTTRDVATSSDLGGYLRPQIEGQDIDEYTGVTYLLTLDRTTLPELNPGLIRDMQLVFTIPEGSLEPGDDLRVDLYDAIPQKSILFYGYRWDPVLAGYAIRNVDER